MVRWENLAPLNFTESSSETGNPKPTPNIPENRYPLKPGEWGWFCSTRTVWGLDMPVICSPWYCWFLLISILIHWESCPLSYFLFCLSRPPFLSSFLFLSVSLLSSLPEKYPEVRCNWHQKALNLKPRPASVKRYELSLPSLHLHDLFTVLAVGQQNQKSLWCLFFDVFNQYSWKTVYLGVTHQNYGNTRTRTLSLCILYQGNIISK